MTDEPRPDTRPRSNRSDEIELEPWYKDGNDDIVEPDQVTLQTQYFWKNWVRILGVGPAGLLIRLRMYCYDNRKTGERRDWCFPGQRTLADELGVHRETIMTWLRRLEVFDFIRRKPRTRWSAEHGRPVRTTNAYRIKMWDPVTPEQEGAAFVRDAQRMLDQSPNPFENQPDPDKSEKPTYGPNPVENRPHESKNPTHDAVEKTGNRKKYLEGVLKNVNVATHTKERLIQTRDLAQQMLEQLGDRHSMGFYRKVAQVVPDTLIYRALSETKEARHEGNLSNAGAYFTSRIKQLAAERGISL